MIISLCKVRLIVHIKDCFVVCFFVVVFFFFFFFFFWGGGCVWVIFVIGFFVWGLGGLGFWGVVLLCCLCMRVREHVFFLFQN